MTLWLAACVFITQADIDARNANPEAEDVDGDGFIAAEDCDDNDPDVSPGAEERPNQTDDDCDGVIDEGTLFGDDDGDGFCESEPCNAVCGEDSCGGDCDDTIASVYPGAVEICDGIQNDCSADGDEWTDLDGDGASYAEGDFDDANVSSQASDFTRAIANLICRVQRIEAGTFTQGCEDAWCDFDEGPERQVTLTQPIIVMETEVLREHWATFSSPKNWAFPDCGPTCPVTRVSWLEAIDFANAINNSRGLPPCDIDDDPYVCQGWRLPTEAEWAWIARGNRSDRWAGSSNPALVGWIADNSAQTVHPARQKQPTPDGLYDLTGNVWEWTWDAETLFTADPVVDPLATRPDDPANEGHRMLRGASADSPREYSHVSVRIGVDRVGGYEDSGDDAIDHNPFDPFNYRGFRLVRTAP